MRGGGEDELHRKMDTNRDVREKNCNGMALMRTENTWTEVKNKVSLVQEHPKISTKLSHDGDDSFGNIIKDITDLYASRQRCINYCCMHCS